MRFKNRYFLVEIIWEQVASAATSSSSSAPAAAAAASTSAAHSAAASSSGAVAASADAATRNNNTAAAAASFFAADPSLLSHHLYSLLRDLFHLHFGDLLLGRALQNLQVKYLNALTNLAIIRINRADHKCFALILSFLTQLKNKSVLFRTVHVSGTIRNAQKAAVQFQKRKLHQLRSIIEANSTTATAASATAAAGAAAATASEKSSKELLPILTAASLRANQKGSLQRNSVAVLRNVANLLNSYNASKAAEAKAQAASAAAATSAEAVQPNAESISHALTQIEQNSAKEIMELET